MLKKKQQASSEWEQSRNFKRKVIASIYIQFYSNWKVTELLPRDVIYKSSNEFQLSTTWNFRHTQNSDEKNVTFLINKFPSLFLHSLCVFLFLHWLFPCLEASCQHFLMLNILTFDGPGLPQCVCLCAIFVHDNHVSIWIRQEIAILR